MKKVLFLIFNLLFLILNFCIAQVPQGIPYQAVARNANGNLIASQAVSVRFSIIDSIATGTVVYSETFHPTTNTLGLFTLNIGQGTVVSGSFAAINWGTNNKFLKVELDPVGGNSYNDMGTTQMMSVPYALYSGNITSPEWTYLSKITFTASNIQQNFTALSVHDQWKLVFNIHNNGNTGGDAIIMNVGLNGVGGTGYDYYFFYTGAFNDIIGASSWNIINQGASSYNVMLGAVIISGKTLTSNNIKSFYTDGAGFGTFFGLSRWAINGTLFGDAADVSAINIIPTNPLTGTVELWFKDNK